MAYVVFMLGVKLFNWKVFSYKTLTVVFFVDPNQ